MTLPGLALQNCYGKLAWGLVFAALAYAMLPASFQRSRMKVALLAVAAMAVMLLPQQYSPAYWLALAFQWPSGLLAACCLLVLARPWLPAAQAEGSMPATFAAPLALLGALLYLDTFGLIPLGLYYWGFSPMAAPMLALGVAAVCVAAIMLGRARAQHVAVLGAIALFSVLRLPTGNLWDALLDPLLWLWAVASLAYMGWRKVTNKNINKGVSQW